jgi:hypothetical protein
LARNLLNFFLRQGRYLALAEAPIVEREVRHLAAILDCAHLAQALA